MSNQDYISNLRKDFPTLHQKVKGKDLVYFDNGATSQKPQVVIDRLQKYYALENANIHRGVHTLSQEATDAYEAARVEVQKYINAEQAEQCIFTSGTTGSINMAAHGLATTFLKPGDEIIITEMEHHSNIVPWQMLAQDYGYVLKYIPLKAPGYLDWEQLDMMITDKTKLLSFSHVSNALGVINPVKEIISKVKKRGVKVLLDGAQSTPHGPVDVQDLDVDLFAFSAHKVMGPTGVGVLYGKKDLLDLMRPYQGGGDMIKEVSMDFTTYNEIPHKFEAGTPNIAGGIAFGAALNYLMELDWVKLHHHENELAQHLYDSLSQIEGIKLFGTKENKIPTVSFGFDDVHHYDIGVILDQLGIAIRTGHHCTQPLMQKLNITGTARASLAFYNTKEEIDTFITALNRALNMLR